MFLATINTPGYLPDSDMPPPEFETVQGAWDYLATERRCHEDETEQPGEYSTTVNQLEMAANGTWEPALGICEKTGTGTIQGPTPGYDGDHDLEVAYSVIAAEN